MACQSSVNWRKRRRTLGPRGRSYAGCKTV